MNSLQELKGFIESETTALAEEDGGCAMFEDFEGEDYELEKVEIKDGQLVLKYFNEDGKFQTQLEKENIDSLEIYKDQYGSFISGRDIDDEWFSIQMMRL